MKNLFNEQEAQDIIKFYANEGVNADLALRVYTSQLLGKNTKLVLHGGGNTSVKTTMKDILGNDVDVLCVKGSGWDLETIGPAGLPALRLKPLLELRQLAALSDEDMVNAQRCQLLDASASNPSIETLLHAFLPHKFIDHTHSNAILTLTNQPNSEALIHDVFGDQFAVVPYVMPGFELAKLAADIYESNPNVLGLILLQHGIFTFANTAQDAYTRMIDAVTQAEDAIASRTVTALAQSTYEGNHLSASDIAPLIRGACSANVARHQYRTMTVCHRSSESIMQFVNGERLQEYSQVGVLTPDHIIRTKNFPLVLPFPSDSIDGYQVIIKDTLARYCDEYHQYFKQHNAQHNHEKVELDPFPRIVLVPGVGMFALGETSKAANINADIYENTIASIIDAEQIGSYQALPAAELFKMEYWSLEQAKLKKNVRKTFTGKVVVISGAAGAIGAATAKAFAQQGAEVALLDVNQASCEALAADIGGNALTLTCDLLSEVSLQSAFQQICSTFGGIDIAILNVGKAFTGDIATLEHATMQQSFELNFYAQQRMAQAAIAILKKQAAGGCLLFNVTKQALNPGSHFGPYGIAKSATLSLMRQYAIECASLGIRSNAVNPDRIRSGLLTDDFIKERAAARGVSEDEYMQGNLLRSEVLATDVAEAFVYLAQAESTTAAILTVDGGNMAAAVR